MFAFKDNYYLYIENTQILNLSLFKNKKKFIIIYRNVGKKENVHELIKFRLRCKQKNIKFFIANDIKLLTLLKADGLYLSAFNRNLAHSLKRKKHLEVIGSAHNYKEISIKKAQGCKSVIFSRLFRTNYKEKKSFLGIVKFNLFEKTSLLHLIPLGGIRLNNLNSLKIVNSKSMAIFSEIKKKPAITSRLF